MAEALLSVPPSPDGVRLVQGWLGATIGPVLP
jgi:hypothetical protein